MKLRPVILCGGQGTRLWPLSRTEQPKPFITLFENCTLFDKTLNRIENKDLFLNPIILANYRQKVLVEQALQKYSVDAELVIYEEQACNTAAPLLLSSFQRPKDELLLIMPADHLIEPIDLFEMSVNTASSVAELGKIVTFGITPNRPETGYGYIKVGRPINNKDAFLVQAFIEKPSQQRAEQLLLTQDVYWNSGIFLLKNELLQASFKEHQKQLFSQMSQLCVPIEKNQMLVSAKAYADVESISFDYAIMEKTDKAAVLIARFDWDDLGDYNALWRYELSKKQNTLNNVIKGNALLKESSGNFVQTDKTKVVLCGLDNLTVVETGDTVLITPRENPALFKNAYQSLQEHQETRLNTAQKTAKPWGYFETIAKEGAFQVKCLEIQVGASLSLQRHQQRAEHWVVVQGEAFVTVGDQQKELVLGEYIYIPKTEVHRIENRGKQVLKIIEIQVGSYLGEDDIVRLEDVYERV